MSRTLIRPGWIASHVVVLLIAVLFVNLGLWQLRRLDERRAANAEISARMAEAQAPLDRVLAAYGNDPGGISYRRVEVRGTYDASDEILLTPRPRDGAPGHHVVTPLVLDDGTAILVERGWIPFNLDTPPITDAAPPVGEVTVTGLLVPTQSATRSGSFSGADRVEFLSVTDVDRVQPQTDVELLPFSVVLQEQVPSSQGLPAPPPAPDLSEGPHLSYALQWFAFTLVGLIGYPLWIRRSLRQGRLEGALGAVADLSTLNSSSTSRTTTP